MCWSLVEKILIDQESVVELCNFVKERVAIAIDKIDFEALDETVTKIRGLYGDRRKLAEYLVEAGVLQPDL